MCVNNTGEHALLRQSDWRLTRLKYISIKSDYNWILFDYLILLDNRRKNLIYVDTSTGNYNSILMIYDLILIERTLKQFIQAIITHQRLHAYALDYGFKHWTTALSIRLQVLDYGFKHWTTASSIRLQVLCFKY